MTTPTESLTDQTILKIYLLGVQSGAASALLNAGARHEDAAGLARYLAHRMAEDPMARTTVIDGVRNILSGRPMPDWTVLRGTGDV